MLGKRIGDARVANLLVNIASRFHVRGFSATQFNLSMSRQDIANYLGLTLETVSRCIGHLRVEKVLEVDGRYIRILDMSKLATLAGMKEAACPPLENVSRQERKAMTGLWRRPPCTKPMYITEKAARLMES